MSSLPLDVQLLLIYFLNKNKYDLEGPMGFQRETLKKRMDLFKKHI
jgi:hypothetical protein